MPPGGASSAPLLPTSFGQFGVSPTSGLLLTTTHAPQELQPLQLLAPASISSLSWRFIWILQLPILSPSPCPAHAYPILPLLPVGLSEDAALVLGSHDASADPELLQLAARFVQSRHTTLAPTTLARYRPAWTKFGSWCAQRQPPLDPWSVPGHLVALYLVHLTCTSTADHIGPSRVLTASNAISCFYTLLGLASPTAHPMCAIQREVALRSLHATPLAREALDSHDIMLLVDAFGHSQAPLPDLMHVCTMLLMFTGCLRFNEASEICVHHQLMMFTPDHLRLFIPKSKTDQYMIGRWVFIARLPGSPYCPVTLLTSLLERGQYILIPRTFDEDVGPLLRPLRTTSPTSHALKRLCGSVAAPIFSTTISTFLSRVKDLCLRVGITKPVGTHSLRIGSASAAAANGVPDRLIKKLGNWQSESVKDHYIHESLPNLLRASRSLGLGP